MTKDVGRRLGRSTAHGRILAEWIAHVFELKLIMNPRLIHAAANLADIGWSEHPDHRAEQVFLRILRMPLAGLGHQERATLALTVASRHSKVGGIAARWNVERIISFEMIAAARTVGLAMRLAYTLTGGVIRLLEESRLDLRGDRLVLVLPSDTNLLVGNVVERRLKSLAKSLNCDYDILFIKGENLKSATG